MNESFILESVIIDPRFQVHYSSYYLYGLMQLCMHVRFGWLDEDAMEIHSKYQLKKGFAFVAHFTNGSKKRVFIDTFDHDSIDDELMAWCDVYGKVNVNPNDKKLPKLVALGPSFAIRLWSPCESICHVLRNYFIVKSKRSFGVTPSFIEILHSFCYLLFRRRPLNDYLVTYEEDKDYVYSMNTLWYDKLSDSTTNHYRGVFAILCKKHMPIFEGGFFYNDEKSVLRDFPEYSKYLIQYADIITKKRESMSLYLKKIKRSSFVFNTPAVDGCLGWKMGEYFALGKAVISTPVNSLLPGMESDSVPFFVAENETDLENAIICFKENEDVRLKMKNISRKYFYQWLAPKAAVSRLM